MNVAVPQRPVRKTALAPVWWSVMQIFVCQRCQRTLIFISQESFFVDDLKITFMKIVTKRCCMWISFYIKRIFSKPLTEWKRIQNNKLVFCFFFIFAASLLSTVLNLSWLKFKRMEKAVIDLISFEPYVLISGPPYVHPMGSVAA